MGLLKLQEGVLSDSFQLLILIYPYCVALSSPQMRVLPFLMVSCFVVFDCCPLKACSLLKENGGGVDLGRGEGRRTGTGRSGRQKIVVGIYCMREELI